MPIIKSAKKRVKVATKARLRNARSKRTMREAIKAFAKAVAAGKSADVAAAQKEAVSSIDQAVKKNLIHKNKAARLKSRLSAQAKAAGVKPSSRLSSRPTASGPKASKAPSRKLTTGKPAKSAAKKPAAKPKTTAKKTPARKPAAKK